MVAESKDEMMRMCDVYDVRYDAPVDVDDG